MCPIFPRREFDCICQIMYHMKLDRLVSKEWLEDVFSVVVCYAVFDFIMWSQHFHTDIYISNACVLIYASSHVFLLFFLSWQLMKL